jgi:hypothetical protein
MRHDTLRRLALVGARARLEELSRERADIVRAFPELARKGAGARGRRAGIGIAPQSGQRPKRTRRRMSATERKAVSQRMKKYWAARRKEKAAQR